MEENEEVRPIGPAELLGLIKESSRIDRRHSAILDVTKTAHESKDQSRITASINAMIHFYGKEIPRLIAIVHRVGEGIQVANATAKAFTIALTNEDLTKEQREEALRKLVARILDLYGKDKGPELQTDGEEPDGG